MPAYLASRIMRRPADAEDRVHLLRFIGPEEPVFLVDLGAHIGNFTADFLACYADGAALVHQERVRRGALREGGRLAPVLPIVLYNGERRWRAAVEVGETVGAVGGGWLARCQPSQRYVLVDAGALGAEDLPAGNRVSALIELENAPSGEALLGGLREVFGRFGGPEERGLREALYAWARHSPLTGRGEGLPSLGELEGGGGMATLHEARAREWEARWFERGRAQGIEQGRAEGRRALLCRQAARKFDAGTAERLSVVLDGLADAEGLAEVGEWIIECETGGELLDRAERVRRQV